MSFKATNDDINGDFSNIILNHTRSLNNFPCFLVVFSDFHPKLLTVSTVTSEYSYEGAAPTFVM